MVRKRAHIEPVGAPASTPSSLVGGGGGVPAEDYDVMTSSTLSILSEAESDLDTSGGSGRSMIPGTSSNFPHATNDSQRGDQAGDEQAWYAHLLAIEDLAVVDPPRGRFLSSLQDLVTKKHAILAANELSPAVRQNKQAHELCISLGTAQQTLDEY